MQFGDERGALLADCYVVVDAGRLSLVEATAHIRAKLSVDFEAVDVRGKRQVLLEVRLAKSFTGTVRQCRDAIRGKSKERRNVLRTLLLDFGVPKDCLPPLGQRLEGIGNKSVFEAIHRGLVRGRFETESGLKLGHVVARFGADAFVNEIHARASHDGEEVRTEREVRPITLLQRAEDARERLGNNVVDVDGSVCVLSGDLAGGVGVTFVEHSKSRGVTSAHAGNQLGITGRFRPKRDLLVPHMPSS